jgi:hypothetical protein
MTVQLTVAVLVAASVTIPVKEYVPNVVALPVIFPLMVFRVRPGGKDPTDMAKVYGCDPPTADKPPT